MHKVGVLALQGASRRHVEALTALGAHAVEVRTGQDLCGIDGLILPGGESTTMSKLLELSGSPACSSRWPSAWPTGCQRSAPAPA